MSDKNIGMYLYHYRYTCLHILSHFYSLLAVHMQCEERPPLRISKINITPRKVPIFHLNHIFVCIHIYTYLYTPVRAISALLLPSRVSRTFGHSSFPLSYDLSRCFY
jgi:hypothetical protein